MRWRHARQSTCPDVVHERSSSLLAPAPACLTRPDHYFSIQSNLFNGHRAVGGRMSRSSTVTVRVRPVEEVTTAKVGGVTIHGETRVVQTDQRVELVDLTKL